MTAEDDMEHMRNLKDRCGTWSKYHFCIGRDVWKRLRETMQDEMFGKEKVPPYACLMFEGDLVKVDMALLPDQIICMGETTIPMQDTAGYLDFKGVRLTWQG